MAALKQTETEMPVTELIRHVSISEQTFYPWKMGYAGLQTGTRCGNSHSSKTRTYN